MRLLGVKDRMGHPEDKVKVIAEYPAGMEPEWLKKIIRDRENQLGKKQKKTRERI